MKKIFIIIIILILLILCVRFLSGEDDWICVGGQWVKHGNPSAPAPTSECK
ncbi:MAG: hypothetical protein NTX96_01090 [Candidatus Zambryskibacteria bacterium]|nr:hypothetical protein [Candidatus Zambryskibacteria bacterium]